MPPGVDLKPLNNQNYPNNNMNNGSSMGPTNSLIVNRNDRSSGPPPLMSQQVSIPGINMPAQSPAMNSYNNNGNTSNIDLSHFTVMSMDLKSFDLPLKILSSHFRILTRHRVYSTCNQIQIHRISPCRHQAFSFLIYQNRRPVSRIHRPLKSSL